MSSSSDVAASTKKLSSKDGSETTTKKITPQRLKGWSAYAASAYGAVPNTRKLDLSPIQPAVLKKRVEEDGVLLMVHKPISVLLSGTISVEDDGRVLLHVDDNVNALHREVEDLFVASVLPVFPETGGKASYSNYYGDNLVKLKEKHFRGRYVAKFRNGARDASLDASDAFTGKRVEIIVKYYGAFSSEEIYGPLITVAAFNVLE